MAFHFWKETVSWAICIPSFSRALAGYWIKWGALSSLPKCILQGRSCEVAAPRLCPEGSGRSDGWVPVQPPLWESHLAAGAEWKSPSKNCHWFACKIVFCTSAEQKEMCMPVFQTNLTCSCFIRWCSSSYVGAPSQPACFPGGTGQWFWTCSVLPSLETLMSFDLFPQAWQTILPSGLVWGVLQSYNPASLLEGRLLSTGHCFTFPTLLPNEPCVALLWRPCLFVFGQAKNQNRTRCNGWRFLIC